MYGLATKRAKPHRSPDARDDDLVARAQGGDREAFEALYRHHVGRIYALCLRMSGSSAEAEELTQQAFVRAWEKLGLFRGRSLFGTWLHRLAVNVVLSSWRGREREKVVAMEEGGSEAPSVASGKPRLAIDLERAIAALPEGARVVFVLHEVEGFKHREIAELTGLAEGTCKAQLHRARQLLRQALG